MGKKTKILALDGGTHGFTWLYCMREIEQDNPGFLAETDVFAGSSFGGFCSLFFARHMGDLKPGESALPLIDACLAFMEELLNFDPDEAAVARFLAGNESMYSHDRMEKVLTDPKHLGKATLSQLHRRVIISACGTKNPNRGPKVYDSADKIYGKARASEVGLEAAALPVMLPLRNGLTNGSLGGTNSSMIALTHVVGGIKKTPLEDIILLSLGGDPETSNLANFKTPWDPAGPATKPLSLSSMMHPSAEDAKAFERLNEKVGTLWKDVDTSLKHSTDPARTRAKLGFEMQVQPEKASPEKATTEKGSTHWGWRKWLTHGDSPLFLYQIITNTEAIEVASQVSLLLGERTLRVAPMALLNYGQILFMTFFAEPEVSNVIIKVAQLTSALWADPETSRKFEFKPNVDQTEAFVDTYWMPHNKPNRGLARRISGWRRGHH